MADIAEFVPFRFKVSLYHGESKDLLCAGYFSEVTGFELTMEPKVIKEGGLNWGEHQRSGPAKFAPMTFKRGITSVNDLWAWFDTSTRQSYYGYRLHGEIAVLGNPTATPDGNGGVTVTENPVLTWSIIRALPTKFKGPDLNATASQIAIEELTLVHEGLELKRQPATGTGG